MAWVHDLTLCWCQVVAMLLEEALPEDVDRISANSQSAIFRACEAGHVDVVRLLLEKGAAVEIPRHTRVYLRDSRSPEPSSVLLVACKRGHLPMVSTTKARCV